MGQVIRKDAAASDIAADAKTTLTNAVARGGTWKELAEEKLGPAVAFLQKVIAEEAKITETLAPLESALDAFDDETDVTQAWAAAPKAARPGAPRRRRRRLSSRPPP